MTIKGAFRTVMKFGGVFESEEEMETAWRKRPFDYAIVTIRIKCIRKRLRIRLIARERVILMEYVNISGVFEKIGGYRQKKYIRK